MSFPLAEPPRRAAFWASSSLLPSTSASAAAARVIPRIGLPSRSTLPRSKRAISTEMPSISVPASQPMYWVHHPSKPVGLLDKFTRMMYPNPRNAHSFTYPGNRLRSDAQAHHSGDASPDGTRPEQRPVPYGDQAR